MTRKSVEKKRENEKLRKKYRGKEREGKRER